MMATRKASTPAAINRQIDAINAKGRKMNPALSEEDAAFVREARARIKELDALVLQAIDARNWTTADKLDVQRGKLWKQVDKLEGRKPRSNNPARSATLVAKRGKNPLPKFGVRVNAGNDRSGNPRRGWIVCELTPKKIDVIEFVDHGYTGIRALHDRHGDIPTMGEFAISAAEYKELKRSGWSDG